MTASLASVFNAKSHPGGAPDCLRGQSGGSHVFSRQC